MKAVREIWWQIKTFIEGMIVVLTYEDDPEMWDNPPQAGADSPQNGEGKETEWLRSRTPWGIGSLAT